MRNIVMAVVTIVFSITACQIEKGPLDLREIEFSFIDDANGWVPFFSDYPQGAEEQYELEFAYTRLPEPLDTNLTAVKLAAVNPGRDLLSCMYVPVTGLIPNATYKVTFNLWIASNIASGGPSDISIGVGALDTIPVNTLDASDFYRPSFEVDLQNGFSNDNMKVLGTLGATDTTTVYTPISRNNYSQPMYFTTNSEGKLFLLVGWDSGYEGKTAVYFKSVFVTLEYNANH